MFIGFLIDKNRQSSTIKSYISAIRAVLQDDGVILDENKFLITSLTRACKLKNDRVHTRLPIQKGLLHVLLAQVEIELGKQPYLKTLYQTIFSTAYYGLLRVGELTSGNHPILARDVHIGSNKKKILFILRTSKTHGLGSSPQMVKITSKPCNLARRKEKIPVVQNANNVVCPFNLLKKYLDMRGDYRTLNEPLFVFRDGMVVTPVHMRNCLKSMLQKAGYNANLYGTHGFRAGRSVDLLKIGLSVVSIRKIGRWTSGAVYTYLKGY